MRILYCHRTRATDGQFVHIRELTTALARAGHEVLIAGPEGTWQPGAVERRLDAGSSATAQLSMPRPVYELAEAGYSLVAYRRLVAAAKFFRPDVLYERYNLFHHAGIWAARRFALPHLLEVNAPLVDERARNGELALPGLGRASEDRIWRAAHAVLPVTAVLADMIAARGVPRDRLHVIANGVDAHALAPADGQAMRTRYRLGDRLVLGFVGFVRDWHGVDRVLDWLASPSGAQAALLLVGDGPAVPTLRAQAERLQLGDRFVVTGVVQRDAVAAHVAAFDIALQPAVTAYASPLKLQEYMAQGRAIIAPDQPNIRETVEAGKTAILIAPNAPDALPRALDLLAADPDLRARLGTAARAAVATRDLTWDGNAARVVRIAEALLRKQNKQ